MRRDLPPPIPFVIQYSDQAGKIYKLVKDFYGDIRAKYLFCGYFIKYNLVTALKRNKIWKTTLFMQNYKQFYTLLSQFLLSFLCKKECFPSIFVYGLFKKVFTIINVSPLENYLDIYIHVYLVLHSSNCRLFIYIYMYVFHDNH